MRFTDGAAGLDRGQLLDAIDEMRVAAAQLAVESTDFAGSGEPRRLTGRGVRPSLVQVVLAASRIGARLTGEAVGWGQVRIRSVLDQ
ncbi:hypothetical protein [Xanthomonas cassavae]|nr:hypothetical protein [Xanthomonas cassavae]